LRLRLRLRPRLLLGRSLLPRDGGARSLEGRRPMLPLLLLLMLLPTLIAGAARKCIPLTRTGARRRRSISSAAGAQLGTSSTHIGSFDTTGYYYVVVRVPWTEARNTDCRKLRKQDRGRMLSSK